MISLAASALHCLSSIKARNVPSSQKLKRPAKAALRSARVLKESNSNSGGANSWGWPPNITRNKVEPERGGESTKMAGGFFDSGVVSLDNSGRAGINCLNSVICAGLMQVVATDEVASSRPLRRLIAWE